MSQPREVESQANWILVPGRKGLLVILVILFVVFEDEVTVGTIPARDGFAMEVGMGDIALAAGAVDKHGGGSLVRGRDRDRPGW